MLADFEERENIVLFAQHCLRGQEITELHNLSPAFDRIEVYGFQPDHFGGPAFRLDLNWRSVSSRTKSSS
jgi:hypothetical protein